MEDLLWWRFHGDVLVVAVKVFAFIFLVAVRVGVTAATDQIRRHQLSFGKTCGFSWSTGERFTQAIQAFSQLHKLLGKFLLTWINAMNAHLSITLFLTYGRLVGARPYNCFQMWQTSRILLGLVLSMSEVPWKKNDFREMRKLFHVISELHKLLEKRFLNIYTLLNL